MRRKMLIRHLWVQRNKERALNLPYFDISCNTFAVSLSRIHTIELAAVFPLAVMISLYNRIDSTFCAFFLRSAVVNGGGTGNYLLFMLEAAGFLRSSLNRQFHHPLKTDI
jgi:hypothetical protein